MSINNKYLLPLFSGHYAFVDASKWDNGYQATLFISESTDGPSCFKFYYYMNGSDIGGVYYNDELCMFRVHTNII